MSENEDSNPLERNGALYTVRTKAAAFDEAFKGNDPELLETILDLIRKDICANITRENADDDFNDRLTLYSYASELVLPGYATLSHWHLVGFQRTLDKIRCYERDTSLTRPLNFLLLASPGSGKTQLVKAIASKLGTEKFERVVFNMATMQSKDDLVRVLDAARNIIVDGKRPLIFLDEFDSENARYPLLLPLLWDGELNVGNRDLRVGRCVVFLAGSRGMLKDKLDRARNPAGILEDDDTKLPDVFSRINGGIVELPTLSADADMPPNWAAGASTNWPYHLLKTLFTVDPSGASSSALSDLANVPKAAPEKVMIAMLLLRNRFKNCKSVPRGLLAYIAKAPLRYEARSIATLIDAITLGDDENVNALTTLHSSHLAGLKLGRGDERREEADLKKSPLSFHLKHPNIVELFKLWNACLELKGDQIIMSSEYRTPRTLPTILAGRIHLDSETGANA